MADPALDPSLSQKKRARRRLVGAAALCLAAAIALPLLFDSEPRRPQQEVQVDIPSRDLPLPATPAAPPVARVEPPVEGRPGLSGADAAALPGRSPSPEPSRSEAVREGRPADPPPDARPARGETKPPARGADKAAEKPAEKPLDKPAERAPGATQTPAQRAAEAAAKGARTTPAERRYVLQIGAFASQKGANEQVDKVKANGLSAYTEKVRTAQGERIRVRVGPFTSREQAEQARGQLKLVGIDSALIAP